VNAGLNREAVAALGVRSGDHALDLGFGGGVGLRELLAGPAARVTGVELSDDMLAAATRRFAGEARLELTKGSADAIPVADGSVDRLLSVHSLYFWPDPEAGMGEVRRVLAGDGRACIALQPREAMEGDPLHDHGFTLYTADDLEQLLRGAGFTDVDVRATPKALLGLAGP
jgi:ubiquinone/menaquinone biosynthesis C-methylase UbiE